MTPVQAKSKIGGRNDVYEQDADRIAERVVRTAALDENTIDDPDRVVTAGTAPPSLQSKRGDSSEFGPDGGLVPGKGEPLSIRERLFFGSRFGHDFSAVRVHHDDRAANAAFALSADAYTIGSDIVFGSGKYEPLTTQGRRLLAHELVHVVQQHATAPVKSSIGDSHVITVSASQSPVVQRQAARLQAPTQTTLEYLRNKSFAPYRDPDWNAFAYAVIASGDSVTITGYAYIGFDDQSTRIPSTRSSITGEKIPSSRLPGSTDLNALAAARAADAQQRLVQTLLAGQIGDAKTVAPGTPTVGTSAPSPISVTSVVSPSITRGENDGVIGAVLQR
jgi:hypothetical protein